MNPIATLMGQRFRGGPPAPSIPFVAIGDVHGRADLLERLLYKLLERPIPGPIVVLGDMIDRGPESAKVLRLLHGLSDLRLVCLRGNHEEMMLDFLDAPERRVRRWLHNGGDATLQSFGIELPVLAQPDTAERCAAELRGALGPLLPWLRDLPVIWRSGNVVAAHAGLDPSHGPEAQARRDLVWGHPHYARRARRDGLWVVHGHVVQPEPVTRQGRIAIDTGAWCTNRLSAARIGAGTVEFVTQG